MVQFHYQQTKGSKMTTYEFRCIIDIQADSQEEAVETFNLLTGHLNTYVSEIVDLAEFGIIN